MKTVVVRGNRNNKYPRGGIKKDLVTNLMLEWRREICGRRTVFPPPCHIHALCNMILQYGLPIKKWNLFSLPLNLSWHCDFLCPTECRRSDVPVPNLSLKRPACSHSLSQTCPCSGKSRLSHRRIRDVWSIPRSSRIAHQPPEVQPPCWSINQGAQPRSEALPSGPQSKLPIFRITS